MVTILSMVIYLYIKDMAVYGMDIKKSAIEIGDKLKTLHTIWDGRDSIIEMRDSGFSHWRQMEWIGFYFQCVCEKRLSCVLSVPGPEYGNMEFDGFKDIPWDFKTHAINTSHHNVILNDSQAVLDAICEYGYVGIILALGKVAYNDDDRTFKNWHEELKGGKSNYELDRIHRGAWSRIRKVCFDLQQISFIVLNNDTLDRGGSFQRGFRNSNGKPRREKVTLKLEKIDDELVYFIDF